MAKRLATGTDGENNSESKMQEEEGISEDRKPVQTEKS